MAVIFGKLLSMTAETPPPRRLIVDIGSGEVPFPLTRGGRAIDEGEEYRGFDLFPNADPELTNVLLQEAWNRQGGSGRVERADATALPLSEGVADEVILNNVLSDPRVPADAVVAEVGRILKRPGGKVTIIETYTARALPPERVRQLLGRIGLAQHNTGKEEDTAAIRQYSDTGRGARYIGVFGSSAGNEQSPGHELDRLTPVVTEQADRVYHRFAARFDTNYHSVYLDRLCSVINPDLQNLLQSQGVQTQQKRWQGQGAQAGMEHTYLQTGEGPGDLVIDAAWAQFLDPSLPTEDVPQVIVCRRDALADRLLSLGVSPGLLQIWGLTVPESSAEVAASGDDWPQMGHGHTQDAVHTEGDDEGWGWSSGEAHTGGNEPAEVVSIEMYGRTVSGIAQQTIMLANSLRRMSQGLEDVLHTYEGGQRAEALSLAGDLASAQGLLSEIYDMLLSHCRILEYGIQVDESTPGPRGMRQIVDDVVHLGQSADVAFEGIYLYDYVHDRIRGVVGRLEMIQRQLHLFGLE